VRCCNGALRRTHRRRQRPRSAAFESESICTCRTCGSIIADKTRIQRNACLTGRRRQTDDFGPCFPEVCFHPEKADARKSTKDRGGAGGWDKLMGTVAKQILKSGGPARGGRVSFEHLNGERGIEADPRFRQNEDLGVTKTKSKVRAVPPVVCVPAFPLAGLSGCAPRTVACQCKAMQNRPPDPADSSWPSQSDRPRRRPIVFPHKSDSVPDGKGQATAHLPPWRRPKYARRLVPRWFAPRRAARESRQKLRDSLSPPNCTGFAGIRDLLPDPKGPDRRNRWMLTDCKTWRSCCKGRGPVRRGGSGPKESPSRRVPAPAVR
jgi:hypothetical protein